MNEQCFVIQPFDKGKFDKRFTDIFEPAIIKSKLEPYRVDRDPSVRIPIDEIEKKIQDSRICFAEITTDNPNVWYELGYAFACKKDVIMVCSDEREGKFPFDIQHRHIVKYKTISKSDYENLESNITKKIIAFLKKSVTVENLQTTPIVAREGLKSHEIALLILIMENNLSNEDSMPVFQLGDEMKRSGYTKIATSMAVRSLSTKKMIETFIDQDFNNNEYSVCKILPAGEKWIFENQDKIEIRLDVEDDVSF